MESWECLAFICVCLALVWSFCRGNCSFSHTNKEVDAALLRENGLQEDQPSCSGLESKHRIFLSHSGAQKPFVEQLCENLEAQNQFAFFDQRDDSLPKGKKFASLILDAAKKCQVAVVVLSREYLTSKWPMLELAEFVRAMGSENKNLKLLPVFFKASVEDLSDKSIEGKWWPIWKKRFGGDRRVDLQKWSAALRELRRANGLRFEQYGNSEVKYRDAIAKSIFRLAPPDLLYDTSKVYGCGRICEILAGKFLPHEKTCAQVLGLYGMGGLGKTTMSKPLCNHFNNEFLGRVCYIEIKEGESELQRQQMVMRKLLRLDKDSLLLQNVSDVSQGWSLLQHRMKDHPVFLIIDNIQHDEESKEEAQNYLDVKYNSGSKIMVISRSPYIVKDLLGEARFCCAMPCLRKEEAAKILLQRAAPEADYSDLTAEQKRVVRSCLKEGFFSDPGCTLQTDNFHGTEDPLHQNEVGHYHPLALRALGVYLHETSKASNLSSWSNYLHEYRKLKGTRGSYKRLFEILGLHFNTLDRMTQLMFLDISLYASKTPMLSNSRILSDSPLEDVIGWLANAHGEETAVVRSKIFDFERFAMISVEREKIIIHDLYVEYAIWFLGQVNRGREFLGVWYIGRPFYSRSLPIELQPTPLGGFWPDLKRIRLENILCDGLSLTRVYEWCNVVVLQIVGCDKLPTISLQGMTGLRHLELKDLWHFKTLTFSGLPFLEFVTIDGLPQVEFLPSFSPLRSSLRCLKIGFCEGLRQSPIVQHCSSLEMMLLVWYPNQVDFPNLNGLTSLRDLTIICCGILSFKGRALKLEILSSSVSFGALGLRKVPVEDLSATNNVTRIDYIVLEGVDYWTSLLPLHNLARSSLQVLKVWRYHRPDNRLEGLDELSSLIALKRGGSAAQREVVSHTLRKTEQRQDVSQTLHNASFTFEMIGNLQNLEIIGERPNSMIEAKLSLESNIELVFHDLQINLERENMGVCAERNNIIVTGIPPDNGFGEQDILRIVREHDSGAEMVSFRPL